MNSTTRVGLLAGASMLAVTGVTLANGNDDFSAMQQRIAAMEAELAALKGDSWTTEARADEVRSIVADVLNDADSRSSLLQSGGSAGWNRGFMLGSADGAYNLKVAGQVQFRFVAGLRDNSADDTVYGFSNRRTKLKFSGNIVDRSWKYYVQVAANRNGGAVGLEQAYIEKDFDGFSVKAGQFKTSFLNEENISSSRQLAAERSLVNETFNQDYSQGVQFTWDVDNLRFSAAFTDGFGSRNNARETEFAIQARVDAVLAGNMSQFADFTSPMGSEYGVKIGAAARFEKDEYGTAAAGEAERYGLTIDGQVEGDGWNFFGAFIYNSVDTGGSADPDQIAIVLQGGYYFQDDLEGFARYEYADFDVMGAEDLNVFTVGVNKYFASHSAKWTTDIGFAFDSLASGFGGTGFAADSANEDGQIVFRSQFQLLF
ncbi:MAG: porin [Phycisphaerales bacterium]